MVIFKQSLKRLLANKYRLIILILGPLLFISLFATISEQFLIMGVVDNDNTAVTRSLIDDLSEQFMIIRLKKGEILDRTLSNSVDYSIIIDSGFTEELLRGEKPVIKEYYFSEKDNISAARMIIKNFLQNINMLVSSTNYDSAEFYKAFSSYNQDLLSGKVYDAERSARAQTQTAVGFLAQFMIYMSVITAGIILSDKENGTFYRTFYAPVSVKRYITENLLAFSLVGVLQGSVVLSILKLGFRFNFAGHFIEVYTLVILFSLVCIAMGILVISFLKKTIHAYLFVGFLATPLIMLGGGYWPKEFMPEILQNIALFTPTLWLMDGIHKILYQKAGFLDLKMEMGILLLFALIFFAGGLFKKVDIAD